MPVDAAQAKISVTVGDTQEAVELWPQHAVFWPGGDTLLVADLHWGKGETFRHHGIPVPGGMLESDLERLTGLVQATGADRVIFLGDLIHGRLGITPQVVARIADWRAAEAAHLELILIRGNHDRHCKRFPAEWRIDVRSAVMTEGPFAFAHHPEPVPGHYTWAGHVHPAVQLTGSRDRLRFPCFHLQPDVGVLPAFGSFTGGYNITKVPQDRIFAVVEGSLISL